MSEIENASITRLTNAVIASSRYKNVSPELIRNIGTQELAKGHRLKAAIKATKNKLHQIGGAYLKSRTDYESWLDALQHAYRSTDANGFRETCRQIMTYHASTCERLLILEKFYTTILAHIGPVRSVLDVACGFNPLSIPWMPLEKDVVYYACDVYQDMIGFLNGFLKLIGVAGQAEVCDVIQAPAAGPVDVAFVLKTIPCLEQVDKSAGLRLLDSIDTKHLLVSFPVHSLGGRHKGMVTHYEARFREMVAARDWSLKRFEFATELAFLVTKS